MSNRANLVLRLERLIRANLSAGRHDSSACSAAEQPPAAASWPHGRAAPGGEAARALIVEADLLHRQLLARLVERMGFEVDTTSTANEGTAAFGRRPYALVLLDCDSQETNGLGTAAALRSAENGTKRTPIVAVTARAGQEDRKTRESAGIDNYISKPILRENVESVVAPYAPVRPAETPSGARDLALDRHRLEELEDAAGYRADLMKEWIAAFLAAAPEQLGRMEAAIGRGDAGALCDAAMRLGSLSGQFGARRLQEICGIAAALGESGALAGVESLLPELAIALERASVELHTLESDLVRGDRKRRGRRAPREGNHVLLAEADLQIALFLANSLAGAGFRVTHVAEGGAAIAAIGQTDFSVAILDLELPEADGYTVLAEIRKRPEGTPVIIISSRREEQDILRAFRSGADDYVTIPLSPLELAARASRLVRQEGRLS